MCQLGSSVKFFIQSGVYQQYFTVKGYQDSVGNQHSVEFEFTLLYDQLLFIVMAHFEDCHNEKYPEALSLMLASLHD